jgi:hypothetical protein
MVPYVHYVLLYSLKTLFDVKSTNALAPLLFSNEALMQLLGFNVQHERQGVCQRGPRNGRGSGPCGRSARRWN